MGKILIKDAFLVNEGSIEKGSVLIENERISKIIHGDCDASVLPHADQVIDARGKYLIPGAIDDHVHFCEPGLTHKADIASESRAAVAGGTTTFMDMPNTSPQTVTEEALEWKRQRASETSVAKYAFYIGGNNSIIEAIKRVGSAKV